MAVKRKESHSVAQGGRQPVYFVAYRRSRKMPSQLLAPDFSLPKRSDFCDTPSAPRRPLRYLAKGPARWLVRSRAIFRGTRPCVARESEYPAAPLPRRPSVL